MTDGMKSGAGSDPFADDSNSDEESPESNNDKTQESESQVSAEPGTDTRTDRSEPSPSKSLNDRNDLPYIFRRNGVKDDRKMIQYFLRDDTEDIEADAKHAVEQELGTDVYLTDLREALVRVGAEHVDEVADELREWGYRYREE